MQATPRLIPLPLCTQVLIAACGTLLGVVFGQEPYLGGLRNVHLVTLLKTLAIPLIFFATLDALVRTSLPLVQGTKLPYLRAQCCHHAGGVFETGSSPLP